MPPKKEDTSKSEEKALENSIKSLDINENVVEEDSSKKISNELDKNLNNDQDNEKNEQNNEESGEEDEEEDDDVGWITPSNLEEVKKMNLNELEEDLNNLFVKVACMTSDFAMQVKFHFLNFLKISYDGNNYRHS